ncbi:MAG: acyltransferase [Pseudomonadota bacterium]
MNQPTYPTATALQTHTEHTTRDQHLATSRRYDLDWLRVLAFGVLIYFHAAVAFLPSGIPMTINAEASKPLTVAVVFFHQFRLALLFFVSGCGVYFALRSRDPRAFFIERSQKLLIPLGFGIVALVPLMVYLEKLYIGESFHSFSHFYSQYFTEGTYPKGNLSWHHFWFLAYLYLFCLLAWPLLKRLRGEKGNKLVASGIQRHKLLGAGIYRFILPLLLVEIFLRPLFPGFRDLIHDWASFFHWFLIFLAGYVFALDRRLLQAARQLRRHSLCGALLATGILFWHFWVPEQHGLYPFPNGEIDVFRYLVFCAVRISNVWLWILVCVGYAARYLNQPANILTALNRAVYPVFCLHLPVLVVLQYFILPLDLSVTLKFLLISNAAVLILAVLYTALHPFKFLHPLIGMR